MNVITTAQKGATERSAERYVSVAELDMATNQLENGLIPDGMGNLVLGNDKLKVEVSRDELEDGSKVALNDGLVYISNQVGVRPVITISKANMSL